MQKLKPFPLGEGFIKKYTYSVCEVEAESESVAASSELLSSEISLDGLSEGAGGIAVSVIFTVFLLLFAVVSLSVFTVLSAV